MTCGVSASQAQNDVLYIKPLFFMLVLDLQIFFSSLDVCIHQCKIIKGKRVYRGISE